MNTQASNSEETMNTQASNCESCEFACATAGGYYQCRRRAPWPEQVQVSQDIRGVIPQWPIMQPFDWCGSWRERGQP